MSDERLRQLERNYSSSPDDATAHALAAHILRSSSLEPCSQATIARSTSRNSHRPRGSGALWANFDNRWICFSTQTRGGLRPVAYRVPGERNCYTLGDSTLDNSRNIRHINEWRQEHGLSEIDMISEIDMNWAIAERFECRLYNLLRCYTRYSSNSVIAGLVADTYLQSKQAPNAYPIRVFEGIEDYRGRAVAKANACSIDLGTFTILFSYDSPSAAVNNFTKQCFYVNSRSVTTSKHIGQFIRSHNLEESKWQKDCIELPQCVFDALFS